MSFLSMQRWGFYCNCPNVLARKVDIVLLIVGIWLLIVAVTLRCDSCDFFEQAVEVRTIFVTEVFGDGLDGEVGGDEGEFGIFYFAKEKFLYICK